MHRCSVADTYNMRRCILVGLYSTVLLLSVVAQAPQPYWQQRDLGELSRYDSADALVSLASSAPQDPVNTASAFILALQLYEDKPEAAREALASLVSFDLLDPAREDFVYRVHEMLDAQLLAYIGQRPYIARSYFVGSERRNGYRIPDPQNLRLEYSYRERGSARKDQAWILMRSSGSSEPRLLFLLLGSDGRWRVQSQDLVLGILEPSVSASVAVQ